MQQGSAPEFDPADHRLAKLFRSKIAVADGGCWLWAGCLTAQGYAYYNETPVHRYSFQRLVGAIPDGLQLDHQCHDPLICTLRDDCPHRRCVNPAHLKPVTIQANVHLSGNPAGINVRKTMCPAGHPYDAENTLLEGRRRRCRICRTEQLRRNSNAYRLRRLATTRRQGISRLSRYQPVEGSHVADRREDPPTAG